VTEADGKRPGPVGSTKPLDARDSTLEAGESEREDAALGTLSVLPRLEGGDILPLADDDLPVSPPCSINSCVAVLNEVIAVLYELIDSAALLTTLAG
jgi:hypothetical protein